MDIKDTGYEDEGRNHMAQDTDQLTSQLKNY